MAVTHQLLRNAANLSCHMLHVYCQSLPREPQAPWHMSSMGKADESEMLQRIAPNKCIMSEN